LLPICTNFLEKKGILPPQITVGLVALLLGHLRFPDQMRDSEENKRYFKHLQASDASKIDQVIQASQELFEIEDRISLELGYSKLNGNS
jgi:hypothetical protein